MPSLSKEVVFADLHHDEVPSITEQTKFRSGFFHFGQFGQTRRLFNPGLYTASDGQDWLVARVTEEQAGNPFGQNRLWAFSLDAAHNPQRGIKIEFSGYKNQHWEDPRVTTLADGRAMVTYTTFCLEIVWGDVPTNRWWGAHQQAALLDENFQPGQIIDPIFGNNGGSVLSNLPDEKGAPTNEKNWLWFHHDGRIHTLYLTDPHQVVAWNQDFSAAETVYETEGAIESWWRFGHARGGTPPVRVGNEYWSFFHSSTPWKEWTSAAKRRYHMAAYAFEAKPPFRITRFAKLPILTGSPKDPWGPGQPLVVFPCGALLRNGKWLVTLGVNDTASAWIEIPHGDLEKLTPIYAPTEETDSEAEPPTVLESACWQSADVGGVEEQPGIDAVGDEPAGIQERSDCDGGADGQQSRKVSSARRRMRRRRSSGIRKRVGL